MSPPDIQLTPASSDDKALRILNAVMFFGLVLLATLVFVWIFVSSIGPAMAVLDRLPVGERTVLSRAATSIVPAVVGLRVLWWGAARLMSAVGSRR